MKLTFGNQTIQADFLMDSKQGIQGVMHDCLQIITREPLTGKQQTDLKRQSIHVEDGRIFEGYSALASVSYLLYKPLVQAKRSDMQSNDLLHAMAREMTDEQAIKFPEAFPSMTFDGETIIPKGSRLNWSGKLLRARDQILDDASYAPDVQPELWEVVQEISHGN